MRLTNNELFPRPILRNIKEDFNSEFKTQIILEKGNLKYKIELTSNKFKELIEKEDVSIYLHIYSNRNYYRNIIKIDPQHLEGYLNLKELEIFFTVDITFIICANKDLTINIKEELLDEEDNLFVVNKGMILGYDESYTLEIDTSNDQIEDLVVLKSTDRKEDSHKVFIDNCIKYNLYEDEYTAYKMLNESQTKESKIVEKLLHKSIITNMLLAIASLNEEELESKSEERWYKYIEQRYKVVYDEKEIIDLKVDEVDYVATQILEINFKDIYQEIVEN